MILNPLSIRNYADTGAVVCVTYDPCDRDVTVYVNRIRLSNMDDNDKRRSPAVLHCAAESLDFIDIALVKLNRDYPMTDEERTNIINDERVKCGITV